MKTRLLKLCVVSLTLGLAILVTYFQLRVRQTEGGTGAQRAPQTVVRQTASSVPVQSPDKLPDKFHQEKVLELALQKKPGHVPVLFQLAQMESESGHMKEAEGHLQQILRAEPSNIEARLELGKVQFQLGDVGGALENTQAILKLNPTQPDARYNLGAMYGNIGNKERALEYWNRLLASNPNSESGKRARQLMSQLQRSAP